MIRVAILIDRGNVRVLARRAGINFTPESVERLAAACTLAAERVIRVLYYDCPPYRGKARLPISGETVEFNKSDGWLRDLARKDLFAVRQGVLKFRGFKPRSVSRYSGTA